MNNYFLSIEARQEPFPIGLDDEGRARFSVNFDATAASPVEWTKAVVAMLHSAGLGTFGTNIFIGALIKLPPLPAAGPFITVIDTGGTSAIRPHASVRYPRLSVQLIITALSYLAAEAQAIAACNALDGQYNVTVAT